jgi:hypothetical protein
VGPQAVHRRRDRARSRKAIETLKQLCQEHLGEDYRLEVIDLRKNPALARW